MIDRGVLRARRWQMTVFACRVTAGPVLNKLSKKNATPFLLLRLPELPGAAQKTSTKSLSDAIDRNRDRAGDGTTNSWLSIVLARTFGSDLLLQAAGAIFDAGRAKRFPQRRLSDRSQRFFRREGCPLRRVNTFCFMSTSIRDVM